MTMTLNRGDRILYSRDLRGLIQEAVVVERSPSGRYVKLKHPDGSAQWYSRSDILVLERLKGG